MAVTMLISLYSTRVILDNLGEKDFGLFNLVAGVIVMFGFFQDTMTRATLRYLCFYKGEKDIKKQTIVFNASFLIHIVIAGIICINLIAFSNYIFSNLLNIDAERIEAAKYVYSFMIISFVFTVLTIPYDSILNANENMLIYSIIGIIESLCKLIIALIIPFYTSDKLIFFSLCTVIVTINSLLIKRIYCHKKYVECKIKLTIIDKNTVYKMLSYAGWNFLTSISSLLSFHGLGIILNIFWGTALNAAQGIANQVNGVLMTFSENILKAMNPVINKAEGENNQEKLQMLSFTGTKFTFIVFSLFALPIIFESANILNLWLKETPQWTVIFCQLLLIRTLSNQLTTVFASRVYAQGSIKNYCIYKSILNVLPLLFTYYAFKNNYPPYSMYIIMLIFWELLGGYVVLYFARAKCDINIKQYLKEILVPAIIVLFTTSIIDYFVISHINASIIRIFITSLLSTTVLGLMTWHIFLNDYEKESIINKLSTIKNKVLKQ